MFEVDQSTENEVRELAGPELPYQQATDITDVSLLVWGEHCIECAAPTCYTTCDLYERRPDSRCRRFTYGVHRNKKFPSFRGYGVEIEFKKWAKIEARGNTRMVGVSRIRLLERLVAGGVRICNLLGAATAIIVRSPRFAWSGLTLGERLSRFLHQKRNPRKHPSIFLLEIYNPNSDLIRINLAIDRSREDRERAGLTQISRAYRTTLVLPPGYSRHEIDYRLFRQVSEEGAFDISLTPEGDSAGRLVFLSADFVRLAESTAKKDAKQIKCVVWDLDNTLWDGVLLEGIEPTIRPEALRLLQFLDDRGILLSIASKNDSASAMRVLKALGVTDRFLYPQINWNPKSESVRKIATLLNIGLDTFAFIDDNPFELEQVKSTIPEVLCIDATEVNQLTAHPRFQGSTSNEARMRRALYQEAIEREEDEQQYGADYLGFLRTCNICLQVARYAPEDFDRTAELVQRTNQLNFSGRKYSRSELFEILEDNTKQKYVLRGSDRYGTFGAIGFALVYPRAGELFVEDFMVSCRVQGKFLEQAFFSHLLAKHNPSRSSIVRVNYTPTAKNTPARKVLETIGFRQEREEGMILTAAQGLRCDFIRLECAQCESAPCSTSNLPGQDILRDSE